MPIDKTANHEKIIAAAEKEFLTYGFADASMRRIAAAAGMSASGLYKHFASKEEMFSALVEPAYQGLVALFRQEARDQEQFIGTGDLSVWETNNDARLAVSCIYDHLDAFRLIICKSQGTKYESFLHDLAMLEEKMTLSFMEMLKKQGVKLNEFSEKELHEGKRHFFFQHRQIMQKAFILRALRITNDQAKSIQMIIDVGDRESCIIAGFPDA